MTATTIQAPDNKGADPNLVFEVVTVPNPDGRLTPAVAVQAKELGINRDVPKTFRATDGRVYYYDRYFGRVFFNTAKRQMAAYQCVMPADDERVAKFEAKQAQESLGSFTWARFSNGAWVAVQQDSQADASDKAVKVVKRDGTSKEVVLGAKVGTVFGCPAYAVGPAPSPEDTDHARAADVQRKEDARFDAKQEPTRRYRGTCGCGEPAFFLGRNAHPVCGDCLDELRHGWQ